MPGLVFLLNELSSGIVFFRSHLLKWDQLVAQESAFFLITVHINFMIISIIIKYNWSFSYVFKNIACNYKIF